MTSKFFSLFLYEFIIIITRINYSIFKVEVHKKVVTTFLTDVVIVVGKQ